MKFLKRLYFKLRGKSWQCRELNSLIGDSSWVRYKPVSLSSNDFQLDKGTYQIECQVSYYSKVILRKNGVNVASSTNGLNWLIKNDDPEAWYNLKIIDGTQGLIDGYSNTTISKIRTKK